MKRSVNFDPLSSGPQASSTWRSWACFARLCGVLLILSTLLSGPLIGVERLSEVHEPSAPQEAKADEVQQALNEPPPFLIPEALPFPLDEELPKQEPYAFRIPNAEFSLEVEAPVSWAWRALTSDVVRFSPKTPMSPEPLSVLTFSSGCFGSCDDLSKNISGSLSRHLEALSRQGLTPRVTHWYVHHQGWVEYSFLTDGADGQAVLNGVSMRWEEEWLNALRCEMSAPIDYPIESEELLHLAWKQWIPLFVKRCRMYKVLSWN